MLIETAKKNIESYSDNCARSCPFIFICTSKTCFVHNTFTSQTEFNPQNGVEKGMWNEIDSLYLNMMREQKQIVSMVKMVGDITGDKLNCDGFKK